MRQRQSLYKSNKLESPIDMYTIIFQKQDSLKAVTSLPK